MSRHPEYAVLESINQQEQGQFTNHNI